MKKVRNEILFNMARKDAFTALQKVLNSDVDFRIKDLNAIKKTFAAIAPQREYIEKEYLEIVKKYGVDDGNGNYMVKDPEKQQLAGRDIIDLLSLEEELDIREMDIENIPEFEEVKMNMVEYQLLCELFRKVEEEKKEEETKVEEKEVVEPEVVEG